MNRPKLEFVPKTLADLNIEGIHELNNGRRYGSTQSLSRPRAHITPSSSVGNLSSHDPFKAWEAPPPYQAAHAANGPRASNGPRAPQGPGFRPHPAPRNQPNGRDPWTGDFRFFFCGIFNFYVPFWFWIASCYILFEFIISFLLCSFIKWWWSIRNAIMRVLK